MIYFDENYVLPSHVYISSTAHVTFGLTVMICGEEYTLPRSWPCNFFQPPIERLFVKRAN